MNDNSIRLVIADLDGTLLDPRKLITPSAKRAISDLSHSGILFTLVSGRPPFGMRMYSDSLKIRLPLSGFNGGEITTPDFLSLKRLSLPEKVSLEVAEFFRRRKIDFWLYRGSDWMVLDADIPHASSEARNVAFSPSTVPNFDERWDGITKIVGVSDDHEYLARCELEAQDIFQGKASFARSQPYYLDVTHPDANKEVFVEYLSKSLAVPRHQIATIGDMPSDIPMLKSCGLSIAMGNALESVKAAANRVTLSNTEDGFAHAMRDFVLARKAG